MTRTIRYLDQEKPHLHYMSDSQDVSAVLESIGMADMSGVDQVWVDISEGEYVEVWGAWGIVPVLTRSVERLV